MIFRTMVGRQMFGRLKVVIRAEPRRSQNHAFSTFWVRLPDMFSFLCFFFGIDSGTQNVASRRNGLRATFEARPSREISPGLNANISLVHPAHGAFKTLFLSLAAPRSGGSRPKQATSDSAQSCAAEGTRWGTSGGSGPRTPPP